MATKLLRFEACLGDKFIAWVETPDVSITQTGRIVKIASKLGDENITTVVDLDLIPAYTFAKA